MVQNISKGVLTNYFLLNLDAHWVTLYSWTTWTWITAPCSLFRHV